MKFAFIVALFAIMVAVAVATGYNPADDMITFESFLAQYPKDYLLSSDRFETEKRRMIFESNLESIRQHNARYLAGKETYTQRVNQMADLTQDEIEAVFLGYDKAQQGENQARKFNSMAHKLTKQSALTLKDFKPIDWKDEMNEVVSQSSCGSCWAHAAANCLSGLINIQAGKKMPYPSRQAMTSCTQNPHRCGGTGGCSGATAQLAFDYVATAGGIATEADYPYTSGSGSSGTCKDAQPKHAYTIQGYTDIQPNNRTALMQALEKGPVAVSAYASDWSFYSSGIFSGSKCSKVEVNHAITLTGVGFDQATQMYYYTIMNSWGTSWGEKGYMRLYMSPPNVEEECNTDTAPYDGSACADSPTPPRTLACGCTGILYDSAVPTGIKVLN